MAEDSTEYEGPDPEAPSDLLIRARADFKAAKTHWASWFEEAKECYDFVAGHQWNEDDVMEMERDKRVPITFNRIGPMLDAVTGHEITNRNTVTYRAREPSDIPTNEILSGVADWIRDEAEAVYEETDAFYDALVCGIGWLETRIDYSDDVNGSIVIDRVDPFDMFPDPTSSKRNFEDMGFCFRRRYMPYSEVEARWPEAAPDVRNAKAWDEAETEGQGAIHVTVAGDQYDGVGGSSSSSERKERLIPVMEYQYCDREPVFAISRPETGELVEVGAKKFFMIKALAEQQGQEFVEGTHFVQRSKKVVKRCFIAGNMILEKGYSPAKTKFTFLAITGRRDRNNATWYGVVRAMVDPQRWANKFFSQMLHIINTSAKSGVYVETGAVADLRTFMETHAQPGSVSLLDEGGLERIREKNPGPYPQAFDRLMQWSVDALRHVSGINLEMMGMANRQQAGVVEASRREAGLAVLGTMFDNLRRYRKRHGELLLVYIQKYLSDGRIIRIIGDDLKGFVQLTKDKTVGRYDVIVDEAPWSPSMKEKTFTVLQNIMPAMMKAGMPIPPEFVDFAPLPLSLQRKLKERIQQQQQAQAQKPDPEMIKAQTEQQKAQASIEKDKIGLQRDQMRMQADQQKMVAAQQESAMDLQEQQYELMKALLEVQEQRLQIQVEEQKLKIAKAQANAAKEGGDNG